MIKKCDTIENKRTGQRMTFLKTAAETNGFQLQIECFSPATTEKDPEHIHPHQENRFRIISGQLVFNINGKEQVANAGDIVSIPENTPHCFRNAGPEEAHYIQEFFPALTIGNMFETFFALSHDGRLNKNGAPNLFRTSVIMLKHKNDLRLIKPKWAVQKIVFNILAPIGKLLGYKSHCTYK